MFCSQCGGQLAAESGPCPRCGAQRAESAGQPSAPGRPASENVAPGTSQPWTNPEGGSQGAWGGTGGTGGVDAGDQAWPGGPGAPGPGQAGTDRPGPRSARPTGTGDGQPFRFEWQRLSGNDRIIGVATLVLFISLFLPWFTSSLGIYSGSANGLFHGYMYLTLIVCLLLLAYLVVRAGFAQSPVNLSIGHREILLFGTGLNFVLTLISFIFKPAGAPGLSIGWGYGAFIGLIAALVAVVPEALPLIRTRVAAGRH